MVKEAIQLIGGVEQVIKPGDKILIKPNYTWVGGAKRHSGGKCAPQTEVEDAANTTDPEVIDALIGVVKDAGGEVIVGEGSGGCETLDAFTLMGVDKIAESYEAEMVDLNYDKCVSAKVPDYLILKEIWVPKTVREADVIISVPALKAWPLSGITVSLKNMIGTAPGKYYGWAKMALPHGELPEPTIDKTIVDLAFMNRINLCIVDGLWGNEGTWTKGLKPVKMDLVIAGFDPVAVDSISARVMGFDPEKIRHLNLARERKLGTNFLEEIIIKGESIEDVMKFFEPPSGLEYIVYKEA